MTTSATSLLGLALPVEGELYGTWGDTVNDSITSLLDTAVAGTTTLSSDSDVTLTTTTLASNQARQAIILWTAGGTATRTITAPAQSKPYIVINKTSSTQSIKLVGVGPTTGITLVANEKCVAAWNGVDFVKVSSSVLSNLTGIVPIANGGTNSATAAAALTALGVNSATTGSTIIASGTTAQRDVSPSFGFQRANSSTGSMEFYNGTGWVGLGGASGGTGNGFVYENDITVTANYTITAGKNAMSTGPLTINSGVTITVPSGSRYAIL